MSSNVNIGQAQDLRIELLKPQDEEAMTILLQSALADFSECGTVLSSAQRRTQNLAKIYARAGARYLVAYFRDQIVGGVGIGPMASLPPSEGIGEIRELVVIREARGRGIGAMLLDAALSFAKHEKYKRIYLETTPDMSHARMLFERFGFRAVTAKVQPGDRKPEGVPAYYLLDSAELLGTSEVQGIDEIEDVVIR